MIEIQEKQYLPHTRTARQSRPILNGILFLIATNLIAKGVLGLNSYTPPVQSNLQGSVYLNFGRPTQPTHQQQFLPYTQQPYPYQYTYWNPVQNSIPYPTTPKPQQPIQQHQIINIHDAPFDDTPQDAQYQEIKGRPIHHIIVEKQVINDVESVTVSIPKRDTNKKIKYQEENKQKDNIEKELTPSFVVMKRETEKKNSMKKQKVKPVLDLFKFDPQHYRLINKLAHLKRQASKDVDTDFGDTKSTTETIENATSPDDAELFGAANEDGLSTLARQAATTVPTPITTNATTTSTTTAATTSVTTPATTSASTAATTSTRAATTTPVPTTMLNMTTGNDTGYDYGYGNYTGNENVSITTMSSLSVNTTTNVTAGNATEFPDYYYYPTENYGPSNGNENISITYGPPVNYDHHQPFYSSPVDHYLDNQRPSEYDYQHYDNHYDNYYENHNEYQPNTYQNQMQQFNDVVQKFYNKYDYHYPGAFNN